MNKALKIDHDNLLDELVADARQRYISRNPESAKAHHAATHVMPGGNTRTVLYNDPFPLRIVKGDGAVVTDADGHQYVNLLGEYTAGLFGHSNPIIRKAIDGALDQGINLSAHNYYEIRLANLVCQRFQSIEKVRFTNSGTEANLMAIATARFVSGKSKVLVFHGGYHGGLLYFGNGGIPINAPYEFIVGDYNDTAATASLITEHASDLACVLVEPMMGSAGCIPADAEFLNMLRDQCSNAESILIFDEVMTSRLSGGGAQALYNVTPDMTTLGKYIGGGMTFGAFGGKQEIMEMYNPSGVVAMPHAGTFNNNTVTMAAGVAAIGEVYTSKVADQLNRRGDEFRDKLNALFTQYNAPFHASGIGSLMTLHGCQEAISNPRELYRSDDRLKALLFFELLEQGFYVARRGFIALMLSVKQEQLEGFIEASELILSKHKDHLY